MEVGRVKVARKLRYLKLDPPGNSNLDHRKSVLPLPALAPPPPFRADRPRLPGAALTGGIFILLRLPNPPSPPLLLALLLPRNHAKGTPIESAPGLLDELPVSNQHQGRCLLAPIARHGSQIRFQGPRARERSHGQTSTRPHGQREHGDVVRAPPLGL